MATKRNPSRLLLIVNGRRSTLREAIAALILGEALVQLHVFPRLDKLAEQATRHGVA